MLEGETVGKYKIEEMLGKGGMGAVYAGRHELLERRAAIKVLLPEYSSHSDTVERFFAEAKAATRIEHPGIVQIFDFGIRENGGAYIVMELLRGEPLDAAMKHGRVEEKDLSIICGQIAEALGAAHSCGIVHRDLKPENVFLVNDSAVPGGRRAKILDFGIAKLTDHNAISKTGTNALMGTPMYMSPEQCRGAKHVDARADIYSLGCIVFQLVCGRPPFNYPSIGELFAAHLSEPPPRPSLLGAPAKYDALLHTCLAKSPDDRFPTMAAFSAALMQIGRAAASSAPAPNPRPPPRQNPRQNPDQPSQAQSADVPRGYPIERPSNPTPQGRPLWVWAIGGFLVTLVISSVVLVIVSGGEKGSEPKAAPPATVLDSYRVARAKSTHLTMMAIQQGYQMFRVHDGKSCPADLDELEEYVNKKPMDAWGKRLKMTCTPSDEMPLRLFSAGPDGRFGSDDDIDSSAIRR